jgi:hypothetical protein
MTIEALRQKYEKVINLYEEGHNIKQISRITGHCRKVIKNVLENCELYQREPCPEFRTIEERTFKCKNCGKTYVNKRQRGEGEEFCSRQCSDDYRRKERDRKVLERIKPKKRICSICGNEYIKVLSSLFCSDECRKEHYRRLEQRRVDSKSIIMTSTCKECGKEFSYKSYKRIIEKAYCSDKCMHKALRRNSRHKRRRLIKQSIKETISMDYLIKKYHGRCQICDCKVHRSNGKDWSPNIATIDHIVPVSKGGTHTYDNVQLLCAICNSRKCDNMDGVQLSLFMDAI